MENYIIASKVKKFIKEKSGMNTSAAFFEKLNQDVLSSLTSSIEAAKTSGRKTVMARDFSLYVENPQIEESLVVASKIKKYIKDTAGLSTSAQAFDQLTLRVQKACTLAIQNATNDKRKTVMDRDFAAPSA
ncbi:MAG: hypothetical protein JNM93_02710 [Bacteriovoracaceae bacterium]|nr:hypothetical protein [Bacteriovoracaceae bacterium]